MSSGERRRGRHRSEQNQRRKGERSLRRRWGSGGVQWGGCWRSSQSPGIQNGMPSRVIPAPFRFTIGSWRLNWLKSLISTDLLLGASCVGQLRRGLHPRGIRFGSTSYSLYDLSVQVPVEPLDGGGFTGPWWEIRRSNTRRETCTSRMTPGRKREPGIPDREIRSTTNCEGTGEIFWETAARSRARRMPDRRSPIRTQT